MFPIRCFLSQTILGVVHLWQVVTKVLLGELYFSLRKNAVRSKKPRKMLRLCQIHDGPLTTVIPKTSTKAKDPSPMTMTAMPQSGSAELSSSLVRGFGSSFSNTERVYCIIESPYIYYYNYKHETNCEHPFLFSRNSPMKSVYLGSTVNLPRCALPSCGLYICVLSTFLRSSVLTCLERD